MNELSTIKINDLDSAMKVATMLAKSGYWKETGTAERAFVKIMLGQELGIGPMASMRGIEVDYLGRVTLMANLQAALVKASGTFNYHVIEANDQRCALEFLERNPNAKPGDADEWRLLGISELTIDQAKAANMHQQWDSKDGAMKPKQTWKSYPSDMLFARCITRGVKRYVPHITNGLTIYEPDELVGLPPSSYIEGESHLVETQSDTTTASSSADTTTQNPPQPANGGAQAGSSSATGATEPKPTDQQTAIAFCKRWADKAKAVIAGNQWPEKNAALQAVLEVNKINTAMSAAAILACGVRIMKNVIGITAEIEDELPAIAE